MTNGSARWSLKSHRFVDIFAALATDRRRVVDQEIAGTTNRVVRVPNLGTGRTRCERAVVQILCRVVPEQPRLQVRAVVEAALLPSERSGDATMPTSTVRSTNAAEAADFAQHSGATAAVTARASASAVASASSPACTAFTGPAFTGSGAASAAGARTIAATTANVVVKTAGRPYQEGRHASNH